MTTKLLNSLSNLMEKSSRYGELIVSILFFLFFLNLLLFIETLIDLSVKRWSYIGPHIWPGWILIAGTILSGVYVYHCIRKIRSAKIAEKETKKEEDALPGEKAAKTLSVKELEEQAKAKIAKEEKAGPKELIRFVLIIGVAFVYLSLVQTLGFIISTFIFSIIYLLLLQERRILTLFICPLAIIAFILFVFTQVLAVPLPPGTGVFAEFSRIFY